MSTVSIWIHAVWATKFRKPLLKGDIRTIIFEHMKENARLKHIWIDHINGFIEHVHCLISMNADQSISKIIQIIKGESASWINNHQLCKERFEWQSQYYAVSVSESAVPYVRKYIRDQEKHHRTMSFEREHDVFIRTHGLQPMVIDGVSSNG
jgi:putative transposase